MLAWALTDRAWEIGRAVQQECRDRDLPSFPTRRSSDLDGLGDGFTLMQAIMAAADNGARVINVSMGAYGSSMGDRKSGSAGMPRPRSTLFPDTTLFRSGWPRGWIYPDAGYHGGRRQRGPCYQC